MLQKLGKLSSTKFETGLKSLQSRIEDQNYNSLHSLNELHIVLEALEQFQKDFEIEPFGSVVLERATKLLPRGSGEALSDPTLLPALKSIWEKKIRISANQYSAIAESLIPLKFAGIPEIVFRAYEAALLVSGSKHSPIGVSIAKSVFRSSADVQLGISAFDILGSNIPVDSAVLTSLKRIGKEGSLVQDLNFQGASLDLVDQNLSPGRYSASISLEVQNKPVKFQAPFLVQDPVSIKDIYAWVSDSKASSRSDDRSIRTERTFKASAVSTDFFHAQFRALSPNRKAHQVALKFVHKDSGFSVMFTSHKSLEDNDSSYSFAINFADEAPKFQCGSGDFEVSILVADAALLPVSWVIGTINLSFPTKQISTHPLYAKSLLHSSDITLVPLQEIEHQMRPPARRASSFTSLVFAALMGLPLFALILFILSLKPNLRRLSSISSLVLVGAFFALLLLYAGYWFGLEGMTFYKTIKSLCFFYPALLFVGRYSLGSVIAERIKEEKSD